MKKIIIGLVILSVGCLFVENTVHGQGLFDYARTTTKWLQTHVKGVPLTSTGVFMDDHQSITLPSGSDEAKSIFSFGFGGCVGIATYFKLKNGDQKAMLSHRSPRNLLLKLNIYDCERGIIASADDIEKTATIMLVPESSERDPETNKWNSIIDPDYTDAVSFIQKKTHGPFSLELYDLARNTDNYGLCAYGKFNESLVPKELEVVLMPNPDDSFWRSKASDYKEHLFSDAQ